MATMHQETANIEWFVKRIPMESKSKYTRPQWKSRLNSKRPTLSELELLVHATRLEF